MAGTPITLTLYDGDDQPVKTLTRSTVPWGLLKKAVRIASRLDKQNLSEEDVDALAGLVVAVFGDRLTIQELDEGADITDMLAVMNQIVAKAGSLMPGNPPLPGS